MKWTVVMADPAGNRTAIVRYGVPKAERAKVAAAIMADPTLKAEQVGFETRPRYGDCIGRLEMAGGEFCGNASLCAAALWMREADCAESRQQVVRLRVSGAADPVEVRMTPNGAGCFSGSVRMPCALQVAQKEFTFGSVAGAAPVVEFEGISHVVIEESSPLAALRDDRAMAEAAVHAWCTEQGASCMGLMFLEGEAPSLHLTPLVFVPKSSTLFWESSCASGSAAAGIALAEQACEPTSFSFIEPGGTIRVTSDGLCGETWLFGSVQLMAVQEV